MARKDLRPIFFFGHVTLTRGAKSSVSDHDLQKALRKQFRVAERTTLHDNRESCRFLAAYRTTQNRAFWIITEADRRRSTVLLPEEFQ